MTFNQSRRVERLSPHRRKRTLREALQKLLQERADLQRIVKVHQNPRSQRSLESQLSLQKAASPQASLLNHLIQ